ncbi:MAG: hypothetical protein J5537_12275 [Lachnospiraceae bacterium]|nr:hypothetical protein [Lachnospiraceae bacterium]
MKKYNLKNIIIAAVSLAVTSSLGACGLNAETAKAGTGLFEEVTETADGGTPTADSVNAEASTEESTGDDFADIPDYEAIVNAFVQNKDQWLVCEDPSGLAIRTYDYNSDGSIELVTSYAAGSGFFSVNHFYHVDPATGALTELQVTYSDQEGMEGLSEADLSMYRGSQSDVYLDGDTYYYPAFDFTKSGASESAETKYFFTVKDDKVNFVSLGSVYTYTDETGAEQTTYYDDANEETTQEIYFALENAFTGNKTKITHNNSWVQDSIENLKALSDEELANKLMETLN